MAHFINQLDADFFFEMDKIPGEEKEYQFPNSGGKLIIPFTSTDKRENFLFDIFRGSIRITKITYQNRVRKAFVLRRLDLDGPSHINPQTETVPMPFLEPYNGREILTPHMHIYVEGYGEKWAIPANDILQTNDKDIFEMMEQFFAYCNVKQLPMITKTLLV
jgi:hypothetical protein